jgi:hypothetical protein
MITAKLTFVGVKNADFFAKIFSAIFLKIVTSVPDLNRTAIAEIAPV